MKLSRRTVLASGTAAGLVAAAPGARASRGPAGLDQPRQPAALDRVTLGPGPLRDAQEVNRRRLLATDPDRLLHMFRVTAGLPTSARPFGGWEAPDNELRGHFTGHYMSACAAMAAQGDEALKARGAAVVSGLAECQRALKTGYVSAFPVEAFDRLNRREKVWAPFYTLHKILAGLIDMHSLAGDPHALGVARGLGDWVDGWTAPIPHEHMQAILDTEFGGLGESLWTLQALTGAARYGRAAERFEKRKFLDPLAARTDALTGLHANTHIPQVIAAARKAELTGDATSKRIAEFFWTDVTGKRCFATGGTSSDEDFKAPLGHLSQELGAYTHECCCTHNMLKLTRMIRPVGWRDYYERALLNGVLGTHNPADGMMMYYVPMASGYWKMFSNHDDGFWCCDGTGVESFARLGEALYLHNHAMLELGVYASSEFDWRERGVRVVQESRLFEGGGVSITFRGRPQLGNFTVALSAPAWAEGARWRINDGPFEAFEGVIMERGWSDGDRIEITLPMQVRAEPMADDPRTVALMQGPFVLAGRLGAEGVPATFPYAEPTKPRTVPEFKAEPVPAPSLSPRPAAYPRLGPDETVRVTDKALVAERYADGRSTFRALGAKGESVPLTPFWKLQGERYALYWKTVA